MAHGQENIQRRAQLTVSRARPLTWNAHALFTGRGKAAMASAAASGAYPSGGGLHAMAAPAAPDITGEQAGEAVY